MSQNNISPHVRKLNAHNLRYQKQDCFGTGWFQILTAQPVNCAELFRKLSARLVTVLLNNWCEIQQYPVNSCMIIAYNTLYCYTFKKCESDVASSLTWNANVLNVLNWMRWKPLSQFPMHCSDDIEKSVGEELYIDYLQFCHPPQALCHTEPTGTRRNNSAIMTSKKGRDVALTS